MQTENTVAVVGRNQQTSKVASTHDDPVLLQLQKILGDFLAANSQLTLNGLSKRCGVSEPTLRRIMKGQIKTLVNTTTIISILSYVSKETSIYKIVSNYPGPISDYLKDSLGSACDEKINSEYSPMLNEALKEPNKYLIYKLAVTENGVSADEVKDLLGYIGKASLEELIADELLVLKEGRYHGSIPAFTLHHDLFIRGFKATSDFIKPDKLTQAPYNNLFANISRSVNIEAYREVVRIQQIALRKCLRVMEDPKAKGSIPVFLLAAIDTLSTKSADELK